MGSRRERIQAEELEPRVLLAQVFWDGGAGSDSWHDALNWSNDAVPTAADDVTIGPAANVQLFAAGTTASRSLALDGQLLIRSNRTLNLTHGAAINGVLTIGSIAETGSVFFNTTAAQSITGTGSIFFDTTGNLTSTRLRASAGVALTIAPGITIRGGNGLVEAISTGSIIVNQGTIAADLVGRTLSLNAADGAVFVNQGRYESPGGTLQLDSSGTGFHDFVPGHSFSSLGGNIELRGTLDNTGDNLVLDASTGPLRLAGDAGGGEIVGGTVTGNDGVGLFASGLSPNNGLLNGVSLNAPLDIRDSARVHVTNSLVLNDTITLGTGGDENGQLRFQDTPAQMLGGSGQIVFDSTGSPAGSVTLLVESDVTLTIGSGITIQGGNGRISTLTGGAVINQGTITADTPGRTVTLHTTTAHGFINQGHYQASAGTLVLDSNGSGSHDFHPGHSFSSNGGTIRLTGTLDNAADTLTIDATTGPLQISGGTITGGTINLNDGVGLTFVASTNATLTDVQVSGELVVNSTASSLNLHLLGTTRFTRLLVRASTVDVFFPSNGTIFDEIVIDTGVGATGNATIRPSAAASSLTLAAGGIVRVAATSTRGVSFGVNNTQPLINNGLIEVLAPVSNTADALVTNNGTLTLAAGSLNLVRGIEGFGVFTIAGAATNTVASVYNGTVNLQPGGNLTGAGDFDLVGILNWTGGSMTGAGITTLAAAGELYISGAATKTLSRAFRTSADGFWTEGAMAMSSGTFTNEADTTLTLSGSLMVSGLSGTNAFINEGILRFLSGVEFEFGSTVLYSTLPGSGTEIDGDVVFDEDASFDGSVTLTPTGSISGAGNLVFNEAFIWQGGTLAGPGSITVSALGFMSIEGPDNKHLNTTLDHFAVGGNWTGGCIVMNNGYFTNRAGATFDIFADPMLDVVDGGGSNTFDNAGLITIQTGTVVFGVPGTNTGIIFVIPPDTLVFMDSWTYTPASSLEGPGGVEFAGGSHVFPEGTFSITGPITLSGGGLSLAASDLPYYDEATYTFFGAHWTIGPGETFALSGGEIRRIASDASITLNAGANAPALATLAEIDGGLMLEGAILPISPHGGALTSRGALTLGASSLLEVTGSIMLESASALVMDIGGALPGAQGRIIASIAATLGGTLDARWAAEYTPEGMFESRLIGAAAMSGSWASASYAGAASSDYRTLLQADTLGLRFVHTHRADWNLDLDVTVTDIFSFLTDWFAGNGDFDGESGNQVTDIFAFLTAWFAA